jgi:hypothetical protein
MTVSSKSTDDSFWIDGISESTDSYCNSVDVSSDDSSYSRVDDSSDTVDDMSECRDECWIRVINEGLRMVLRNW